MSFDRTCTKCQNDDEVRHLCTRDGRMTFRCRRCSREFSIELGVQPPVYVGRTSGEAA